MNYHKSLSGLSKQSIKQGNIVEGLAITKAKHIIVSSDWAAQSVINDYNKPPSNISIIPYGANFENIPQAEEILYTKPLIWKLLFVGVYWDTKGGDIAFNAFKILYEKGYNVEFTVLGCIPPKHIRHKKLHIIPFIDKNSKDGQSKMKEIYKEHHFLLLPTRFDCTPIVINEASAFGIPCLVANSGGVAGHLAQGKNGFLLPYTDTGFAYAQHIEDLIKNPDNYLELRHTTRKIYEKQLNWQNWISQFKKIISL